MTHASLADRRPLRFGYKLPNCGGMFCEPEWVTPDTIRSLALHAHECDYDAIWLHDHVVTPTEYQHFVAPPMYESVTTAAMLSATVSDISIGIGAMILPLRDPVIVAKQITTVARFHPGRLTIAMGVGQYETEFVAAGNDSFRRRGRVTDEYLAVMQTLFSQTPATYAGALRSVEAADFHPKPASAHDPAIWIAGNSTAARRRAHRFGTAWLVSTALLPAQISTMNSADDQPAMPVALTITVVPPFAETDEDEHRLHQHPYVVTGDAPDAAAHFDGFAAAGVTDFLISFRSKRFDDIPRAITWFATEVRPLILATASRSVTSRGVEETAS